MKKWSSSEWTLHQALLSEAPAVALDNSDPPIVLPGENVTDDAYYRPQLDLQALVKRREDHQRDYSRTAMRKGSTTGLARAVEGTECETRFACVRTARQQLHARLIKERDEHDNLIDANRGGNARALRYRGTATVSRLETENERDKRVSVRDKRVTVSNDHR